MDKETISQTIKKTESNLFILYAHTNQYDKALTLLEGSDFLEGNLSSSEALKKAASLTYSGKIESALKECRHPDKYRYNRAGKLEHLRSALDYISQAKEKEIALKPETKEELETFFRDFCAGKYNANQATGNFNIFGILYETISCPPLKKNVKTALDLIESAEKIGISLPPLDLEEISKEYHLIPVESNLYENKGIEISLRLREEGAEVWVSKPKPGYLLDRTTVTYYFRAGKYSKATAGQGAGKKYDGETLASEKALMLKETREIIIISMRAKKLERDFLKSAGAEDSSLEDLFEQISVKEDKNAG